MIWIDRDTQISRGQKPAHRKGILQAMRQVATISTLVGQPEITREDLRRMVAVTGRLGGRDPGSTIREVQAALGKQGVLPERLGQ